MNMFFIIVVIVVLRVVVVTNWLFKINFFQFLFLIAFETEQRKKNSLWGKDRQSRHGNQF